MTLEGKVLAIAGAALLAVAACGRGGGDGASGGGGKAPVARIDTAEQARQERNAEISAEQRRVQPQGGTDTHVLSGRVVKVTEHEVVLQRDDGVRPADVTLRLAPGTPVTVAGRPGSAADLKEGTQVRASFDTVRDERVVTRIEVASGGPGDAKR